jgi:hypothetical protein
MIYTALFINEEDRRTSRLDKTIEFQHITHQFRPKTVDERLFGQQATLKVVGYGINEENEGYLVEIVEASEELREAFASVEVPHITIGISNSGKAVNTRYLEFEEIEPFEIVATYGGFCGDHVKF